jgi:hypothetical protein
MDHCVCPALTQSCRHGSTITAVTPNQLWFPTRNALYSRQRFWMAITKIIEYRNIKTCTKELDAGMRTDKAGTTRD